MGEFDVTRAEGLKFYGMLYVKFPTLEMDTWRVLWYPHGEGRLGPVHGSWGMERNAESSAKQKLGLASWQRASTTLSSQPSITADSLPTLWPNTQQQEGLSDAVSKPWVLTSPLGGLDCSSWNADSLEFWLCNVGHQLASWLVSGNHTKWDLCVGFGHWLLKFGLIRESEKRSSSHPSVKRQTPPAAGESQLLLP
ncbi:hypothetical protein P7K49_010007 [Saguinus oedipus]|uniref:Uncharacterized protein n=1 Tax=Saguinus oedipus TaxID=9490 RepID=A0ABQ9VLK5_SAGOE|nr:hypothetical protein P7K49_010007 [Saguinus oedipus]